ncbi:MAG: M23 family metallopeptidase [Candidatus Neomarinimicrobiota bacterium]
MNKLKNLIIQKESQHNVRQWHFNRSQYIAFIGSIICVLGFVIFLVADRLSDFLYEKRLNEYKKNYINVTNNLGLLKEKLADLDYKIEKIEEKDNAVRTYAGMPSIDKDIRKVGIGGYSHEVGKFSDNLAPIVNKELASLEMDIEKLSRQVNLELSSYNTIYEKVQDNIHRINGIPSIRPVDGGYLNSTFGYRIDPIDNVRRFHQGQDITVKSGTPIYSPADGVVKRAYYVGGFGNHIKIQHGSGYTTLFAHLSKIQVKYGQEVKRGDIIGFTGNTGRSTAPHLHYEIHHNGKPENPLDYFFSENNR